MKKSKFIFFSDGGFIDLEKVVAVRAAGSSEDSKVDPCRVVIFFSGQSIRIRCESYERAKELAKEIREVATTESGVITSVLNVELEEQVTE